jgi:beta-glucanase (GH16 family)
LFSLKGLSVPPKNYKLIWSDEFNQAEGTAPDPAKWNYNLGDHGWGNKELERYTDLAQNACVTADPLASNGKALMIQAIKESDGSFTSARINTNEKFSFTYGWVEGRLRLPYGQGIWPAFWMVGEKKTYGNWPHCGEIDIMENLGHHLSEIHGTIHGPGYFTDTGITTIYALPDGKKFKDDYHVFAMEWTEGKIKFFVDDQLYRTLTPSDLPAGTKWVFDHPFILILNLAVGGTWPGYPDSATVFPQTLMVDYLRVYQPE